MFHNISEKILDQMEKLETADLVDRNDGTPRMQRLRQIPAETGKFLALMLANAPAGKVIEIGTSGGYSTMWQALACVQTNRKITTYEILPKKIALATETFKNAELEHTIDLVAGDAREFIADLPEIAYCFLDAEKEVYLDCYNLVVPKLVKGGIIIADNAINLREMLNDVIDFSLQDERVDSMIVPVGNGLLMCRKI